MPGRPAARSLAQASATPPAPSPPAETDGPTMGPSSTESTAASPPLPVFDLQPANVTAVSTPAQFARALRRGVLDIEIRSHLDLTSLLDDIRSAPVDDSESAEIDREGQLDVLAMFQVDVATRSIRAPGEPPLLPLRPFQCLLLVPDTLLAIQRGRLWLDNVYLRLQPPARVLSSLQRTPSFVALGRMVEDFFGSVVDSPDMTELHATDVTFQGHSALSMHAVRAAGIEKPTATFLSDCIFTDWGGQAPPLSINQYASASISRCLFRNMRQQAELVDVSFNGLVMFDNVSFADSTVPPEGRIIGTSMNDYQKSSVHAGDNVGVYYAEDDENYDLEVADVQPGAGGEFGGDHIIEDALMGDCLFQVYDEEDPTPQPGCPQASVEKRAAVAARMRNTTVSGAQPFDESLYYEPEDETGYGGPTVFGEGVPFEDHASYGAPSEPDYELVGAPPEPPQPAPADAPGPGATPMLAADDYEFDYAANDGMYYAGVPASVVYVGDSSVYGGGAGFPAAGPAGAAAGYTYYEEYYFNYYQYGDGFPDMTARLDVLQQQQHPWLAGAQRVLPARPPPPPGWPALTLPPTEPDAAIVSADLVQPLTPSDAPGPSDAPSGGSSEDNTMLTAGVTALLFACFVAVAICACAMLLRRKRAVKADGKGGDSVAGGMLAGGAVGETKPRDEGARQASKLTRQLDSFTDDDLFMGQYELLGRDRSNTGRHTFVQYARGHEDGRPYAVKFFLNPAPFATEATLFAAFQPYLRGSLGPTMAAAAEAAGDAAPPSAPPGGEFLPRVQMVLDGEGSKALDPAGRPLPPCIVMDKGLSLQEWSDSTPPDLFTALAMLSSVSKRLSCLHDAGYVHCDLKPTNVMLTSADKRWTVVGFSHAVRAGAKVPMQFTLAYAAPEVVAAFARGDGAFESAAAQDAWALGVLAVELLTGAPVFKILTEGQSKAIAQLKGEQELPWEAPDTSGTMLRELGMLRGPILQLLKRDPAQRATARQFHTACNQAFAEGAVPLA